MKYVPWIPRISELYFDSVYVALLSSPKLPCVHRRNTDRRQIDDSIIDFYLAKVTSTLYQLPVPTSRSLLGERSLSATMVLW